MYLDYEAYLLREGVLVKRMNEYGEAGMLCPACGSQSRDGKRDGYASVNPATKGWQCRRDSCRAKGVWADDDPRIEAIRFIQQMHQCEWTEARKRYRDILISLGDPEHPLRLGSDKKAELAKAAELAGQLGLGCNGLRPRYMDLLEPVRKDGSFSAVYWQYLLDRGFRDREIEAIGPYYLRDCSAYYGYVVFPILRDGQIVCLNGRYTGEPDRDHPKYRNDGSQGSAVWPDAPVRGDGEVVIVEGIIDALALMVRAKIPNVYASLTTTITRGQVEHLKALGAKSAVLFWDPDSVKNGSHERGMATIEACGLPVRSADYSAFTLKDPGELLVYPDAAFEAQMAVGGGAW